jgi:FAD:protein FMN transferase
MAELRSVDRLRPLQTPPRQALHGVADIMGTVIGVDIRDAVRPTMLEEVFDSLREVDRRFSPFRPDSEVSRLMSGQLGEEAASPELRAVLELCETMRRSTDGYFDARGHRPDSRPDPTGIVKGWSIERVARLLDADGARNYAINAGGDIVARGDREPGRAWRVGIQHPRIADRIAAVLAIHDGAVATSGAYQRGAHIVDPHTGRPAAGLLSVTVYGPDLAIADAYATAAFAMGADGPAWVADQPGYGALAITSDDRVVWTPLIDPLLRDAEDRTVEPGRAT